MNMTLKFDGKGSYGDFFEEYYIHKGRLMKETELAYLVDNGDGFSFWVPKSQAVQKDNEFHINDWWVWKKQEEGDLSVVETETETDWANVFLFGLVSFTVALSILGFLGA